MQEILELTQDIASLRSTVLIRGESGTGKELVARAVHFSGNRAEKPFIAVSCAALTETLLESELFGYEKGAFTGAIGQAKGKFESANAGTIFLDEIGDISPKLQADLLRVLQERRFYRVGGTQEVEVDVRIIAATNKNLAEEVQQGRFREDLYYRLNVIEIKLPPLRERREDVPLLAEHFVQRISSELGKDMSGISAERAEGADRLRLAGQRPRTRECYRACHCDVPQWQSRRSGFLLVGKLGRAVEKLGSAGRSSWGVRTASHCCRSGKKAWQCEGGLDSAGH